MRFFHFFLQDMCFDCHLAGKGGICDVDVPLNRWGDRMWFRMALSVIALSDRFIKRLLPGVHSGEQNFSDNYTGTLARIPFKILVFCNTWSLLWSHWYPCFGLLMMSALVSKPGWWIPFITCFVTYMQSTPQKMLRAMFSRILRLRYRIEWFWIPTDYTIPKKDWEVMDNTPTLWRLKGKQCTMHLPFVV